eukprot:SAG31_NODE_32464_length_355_cov_1.210938_1_plen_34_part_10
MEGDWAIAAFEDPSAFHIPRDGLEARWWHPEAVL